MQLSAGQTRRRRVNWAAGLFLAPAILMLLFIYAGPLLFAFAISFTDWTGIGWRMNFVGVNNYITMFREKTMYTVLGNNARFLVGTVIIQNVLGIVLSTFLSRGFRGRNFFRAVFFLPTIITIVAVGMAFGIIFDPVNGPVVYYSKKLGLDWLAKVRFLGDPKLVMNTIIAVNVWQWTGWNMVVYLAGQQAIPPELYESCSIDGASGWQTFRYVTLPMLAPAITINIVMTTMGGIRVFDLPFVMTGGGPGRFSETLAMSIIRNSFALDKMGLGAAMSIVLSIITLCVTMLQNTFLTRREEAVKE